MQLDLDACYFVAAADIPQRWYNLAAYGYSHKAAFMKSTTGRRIEWALDREDGNILIELLDEILGGPQIPVTMASLNASHRKSG